MVNLNIKFSNKTFYSMLIISALLIVTGIGIALNSGNPQIHGHTGDEILSEGVCLQGIDEDGDPFSDCETTWAGLKERFDLTVGAAIYEDPGLTKDNTAICDCNPKVDPEEPEEGNPDCWCFAKQDTQRKRDAIGIVFCDLKEKTYISSAFATIDEEKARQYKQVRKKCTKIASDGSCEKIALTGTKSTQYLSRITCI